MDVPPQPETWSPRKKNRLDQIDGDHMKKPLGHWILMRPLRVTFERLSQRRRDRSWTHSQTHSWSRSHSRTRSQSRSHSRAWSQNHSQGSTRNVCPRSPDGPPWKKSNLQEPQSRNKPQKRCRGLLHGTLCLRSGDMAGMASQTAGHPHLVDGTQGQSWDKRHLEAWLEN